MEQPVWPGGAAVIEWQSKLGLPPLRSLMDIKVQLQFAELHWH